MIYIKIYIPNRLNYRIYDITARLKELWEIIIVKLINYIALNFKFK